MQQCLISQVLSVCNQLHVLHSKLPVTTLCLPVSLLPSLLTGIRCILLDSMVKPMILLQDKYKADKHIGFIC